MKQSRRSCPDPPEPVPPDLSVRPVRAALGRYGSKDPKGGRFSSGWIWRLACRLRV